MIWLKPPRLPDRKERYAGADLRFQSLIFLNFEHTGLAQKELGTAIDHSQTETLAVIISNLPLKPFPSLERNRNSGLGVNQRSKMNGFRSRV